ncbi:MAG: HEAT repeat domain-containing protein [Deltaproteobacteria bacterium]|nr:HEAT repeat domain-containing protein [Deltaproteobacteria bacterium]
MRSSLRALALTLALWPAVAAAQDFDPAGRRPQPRGTGPGERDRPREGPGGAKGPSIETLIERYTAIVLQQPAAAFPLQKLAELYRQRDGSLDKLVAELEQRAAEPGPGQFAARLALAAIYAQARRPADAARTLAAAATERARDPGPRLLLARLAEEGGDRAAARRHYEAALGLLDQPTDKEQTTRALMLLCLDLGDFVAAERYHALLVRAAGGSLFVKRELGRELMARGEHARAEIALREVVTAAAGDNRALAPALRDLGESLARQKRMAEALEVLGRARRIAGAQAGMRAEILGLLTDVYREQGRLAELIAILESEAGGTADRDWQRLATIGALCEETGQVDKAIATFRQALRLAARNVELRVKLVHLLQAAGQLDEAVREYEALVAAAPRNAEFVFELAETLIQRGDRGKALGLLADLERRSAAEPEILATVADFYERIEEPGRAIKVLERLASSTAGDPRHIIDLGDRYFQSGDQQRAVQVWARIRTVVPDRARAAAQLGEIYLEHDMPAEALEALREATRLAPQNARHRKALAVALERTAGAAPHQARYRHEEALALWEQILKDAGGDQLLEREARSHVVSLWAILRVLPDKVAPLAARLAATPPDLGAGRLLAEVQRRLQDLPGAEATLRTVIRHAPGDESSLLALERVLVMERKLTEAVSVLARLAQASPKRARECYQRMSQYAAELYRDDEAIEYAARAVELSPDDALGHHRLALMYRRRQDTARAAAELRRAIAKNDELYAAYFDLAELVLSAGDPDEADRLYRAVVRKARDEQYVVRAARLAMQLGLGRGTLESLERELLPVALGSPNKAVYRRLLVELYGAMAFPLVHAARRGSDEAAAQAREKLSRLGARAVKPLLDALGDAERAQQRVAIEVLAYVQNRDAGPALFNFATGPADRELRERAMVACGTLADPALLPRYEKLLAPARGEAQAALSPAEGAVAVAAAWGVARLRSPKALPLLRRLLSSSSPDVRALAALGLGLGGENRDAAALAELARSPEAGPLGRAAAAHGLGELGDRSARPLLLALTDSTERPVRVAAMLALARLDSATGSRAAAQGDLGAILARALLSAEPDLRQAALLASSALGTGQYRRDRGGGAAVAPGGVAPALPVPDGPVIVREVIEAMAPAGYTPAERAGALLALGQHLVAAAAAEVATSPERALVVAELGATGMRAALDLAPGAGLDQATERALSRLADEIGASSVEAFTALVRHPVLSVREGAIQFLARRPEAAAHAALSEALDEADPALCKTALAALGSSPAERTLPAVLRLLAGARAWPIRARAAEALGRLAPGLPAGAEGTDVDRALGEVASRDPYALVREAALRALATRNPRGAQALLREVAQTDPEPRLRELAHELARE